MHYSSWIEFERRLSSSRRTRPDGQRAATPPPLLLVGPDPVSESEWVNELSRPARGILVGLALMAIVGILCGCLF